MSLLLGFGLFSGSMLNFRGVYVPVLTLQKSVALKTTYGPWVLHGNPLKRNGWIFSISTGDETTRFLPPRHVEASPWLPSAWWSPPISVRRGIRRDVYDDVRWWKRRCCRHNRYLKALKHHPMWRIRIRWPTDPLWNSPRVGLGIPKAWRFKRFWGLLIIMDVSENSFFSPQIIHFNRVFHYFHHPFWGTPIFGNTHI